jgi:DNA-binding response OmpR family regulator
MRVLLAEDEKKVAQHVRTALREQGFTVDMVHRGDEALDAALATPYDALVLDVMMPGRDGLSILRVLREKRVLYSGDAPHCAGAKSRSESRA